MYCEVTDLVEISFVHSIFADLTSEPSLWHSLARRAFPELTIQLRKDMKMRYKTDILPWYNVVGVWCDMKSGIDFVVSPDDGGLRYSYINCMSVGFGPAPALVHRNFCFQKWDIERQQWSRGGLCLLGSVREAERHIVAIQLNNNHRKLSIQCDKCDVHHSDCIKLSRRIYQRDPRGILNPGLFVKTSCDQRGGIVRVEYANILMVIDGNPNVRPKVCHVDMARALDLEFVTRQYLVSDTTLSDEAFLTEVTFPRRHQCLPESIRHYFGSLTKYCSNMFLAAFPCFFPSLDFGSCGFCIIFSNTVFCVVSRKFGLIRFYHRLPEII